MVNSVEEISFEKLYKDYGKQILNLAYRFTGNPEVSRDLTQDVFLKVYQNLDSFRRDSQPFTWIYRIAMNHFINYLKRERKWKWYQLLDKKIGDALEEETTVTENIPAGHFVRPDKAMEKTERERIVLAVINSLPLKYRAPLMLQRYDDLGNQQIADALSLSISAVETRIHRAKKMLMEKLKPWLKDL